MPGMLVVSGLGVTTVGLFACVNFLDRATHGLSSAGAIALLGAGAVLALIGLQFFRGASVPRSATRLVVCSVARSVLVMALIGTVIAVAFGYHFALDMARVVGQAFSVVVVIDLVTYLSALQVSLMRARR